MTVAAYATDLNIVDDCEDTTGWSEMTNRTSGGAATQEDRAYLQGSYSVSQSTGVATGRTMGLQYDYGSNITWTSGWVFLIWQMFLAPKVIGTWADGGMRLAVGSSAGNVNLWNTMGNNAGRNPYGGWTNTAVDPTYTADETDGSPTTGNYRIFCSAPYLLSSYNKGNPHVVDIIRYGRGQLKVEYGESGSYGTFAGMASANDADSARWGLFSYQMGSYLWKGLMSLGTATNAVDFRDSNRSIVIDDCPRTYAAFNKVELRNSSSRVDWTNITFYALGTLSKGDFECVDDVDLNATGCVFIGMNTFIFKAASAMLNATFLNCAGITANGATFTGTKFLTPTVSADASGLDWNTNVDLDGKIDNCVFTRGTNAHHAIRLNTSAPTSVTIRGVTFSGFNASNGENDSVLYLADRGSDTAWTIACVGCTGTVTYKKARSGDTVTLTQGVSLAVHVQDIDTGSAVEGARVLVACDSGGDMPSEESVSITRSGSTATVSHTGHGMVTGDWVLIEGCTQGDYNGVWQITYIGADSYSYDLGSKTPTSPATGSPIATFCPLHNTTNSSGNVSATRTYSSDQPFWGRVRLRGSTLYKTQPISGTIDSATGAALVVQLIKDV